MRLSVLLISLALLLAFVGSALAESVSLLPQTIGKFRQVKTSGESSFVVKDQPSLDELSPTDVEEVEYAGKNGGRALVRIARFRQDPEAYEAFSLVADTIRDKQPNLEIGNSVGTAGFVADNEIAFVKGTSFVRIRALKGGVEELHELAHALNETLDKGEADIPALIKHLPEPEEAQKKAIYLHTFAELNALGLEQPVLSAVQSGGNADAVLGVYGPSKVLIVEFNTPQLATENDRRIIARIQELWKLSEPAPTAYRRVGNYSVFVFDAPDEQTAKRLIDQVKYEQVVQWLGENPNIFKEAEKRYINTTLGVLIAVLKASGYALIACLGIGGLIGGLLFSYRRAQQKTVTFSDAGGMLRLNLDDLTAETDPSRLLRERN